MEERKGNCERVIREARSDDAEAILAYLNEVAGESENLTFEAGAFRMSVEQEATFLENLSLSNNCVYLLALEGERIIGVLSFIASERPRIAHMGEIGVSVRKECWNQGVASALFTALLNWVRTPGTGIRKINLTVRNDNKAAISLYKKFGFVQEGVVKRLFSFNGEFIDGISMGLLID